MTLAHRALEKAFKMSEEDVDVGSLFLPVPCHSYKWFWMQSGKAVDLN